MNGPRMDPRAQAARTMEKYLGRWRRGMMSAKMTCVERLVWMMRSRQGWDNL